MNRFYQHPHRPVMLEETVSRLVTEINGVYLDCTVGFGGHSSKLLEKLSKKGTLIGIDYDPYALEYSKERLSKKEKKFKLFLSNYNEIKKIAKSLNINYLDGILFDLGVSSHQVDSGHKGLSYKTDSPLNMKMDKNGFSLKDFLNNSSEENIANVIYKYSEERGSRKIAKSIYDYKRKNRMNTNIDLVEAVKKSVPERYLNKTLSRVFQAFRIHMNDELSTIYKSITVAIDILKPGGRLAVITFHSIEDRLVKNIFRSYSKGKVEYLKNIGYDTPNSVEKKLTLINKKPISPSREEIKDNKRSRSAKLRVAERI